jgi:hypothetical protein
VSARLAGLGTIAMLAGCCGIAGKPSTAPKFEAGQVVQVDERPALIVAPLAKRQLDGHLYLSVYVVMFDPVTVRAAQPYQLKAL